MMATTHLLAGTAIAAVVSLVAPEFAPVALLAGVAGGTFPDLDLFGYHRRTLHFPTYYSIAAVLTALIAIPVTTPVTVGIATFFLAAAFHSRMDRYGGGLELRPWLGTSDRAVYDHATQQWHRPLQWVRYDGAPEDLLVAAVFAIPAFVVYGSPVQFALGAVLTISAGYVVVRKQLPDLAVNLAGYVPNPLRNHVPSRFLP